MKYQDYGVQCVINLKKCCFENLSRKVVFRYLNILVIMTYVNLRSKCCMV